MSLHGWIFSTSLLIFSITSSINLNECYDIFSDHYSSSQNKNWVSCYCCWKKVRIWRTIGNISINYCGWCIWAVNVYWNNTLTWILIPTSMLLLQVYTSKLCFTTENILFFQTKRKWKSMGGTGKGCPHHMELPATFTKSEWSHKTVSVTSISTQRQFVLIFLLLFHSVCCGWCCCWGWISFCVASVRFPWDYLYKSREDFVPWER